MKPNWIVDTTNTATWTFHGHTWTIHHADGPMSGDVCDCRRAVIGDGVIYVVGGGILVKSKS